MTTEERCYCDECCIDRIIESARALAKRALAVSRIGDGLLPLVEELTRRIQEYEKEEP